MDGLAFLNHLRHSRLLSEEELNRVATRFGERAPPHVVASTLVEDGVLTRFQAKQLWAGKAKGLVLGQYRILDELGKGGFGQVFKALHTLMNRVVAIKVIAPELVEDSRARSMFHREVLASTQLCHPNIVMAYDANEVDDVLFLVMEYVDGPNLDTFVKEQGPLPCGLACEIARQAALALQHANDKGMVHRDIKPGNLLLPRAAWSGAAAVDGADAAGQPGSPAPLIKVVDFGLARLHRSATAGTLMLHNEKSFLGTPDYVSPEQARNLHAVDIRSDLYSLGCTLYFTLTARRPFCGTTVMEVVVKHLETDPDPLEVVRPDVPPEIRNVVHRLMAKNPDQRFQTPAELVAALAPLCEATPGALAACTVLTGANADASPAPWTPRATDGATALVPDLAFWQGPERIRAEEPEPALLPPGPAAVPAVFAAVAEERLPRPVSALVQSPHTAGVEGQCAPAALSVPCAPEANGLALEARHEPIPAFHASAALRKCWGQWVSVIEAFVKSGDAQVDEPAYRAVRAELLEHCRAHPRPRPGVLERIESLIEPWLRPRTLASIDRQSLASLLARCGEISRELGLHARTTIWSWLGAPALVSAVAVALWYLERTQHVTASVIPWSERLRGLVMAHPLPSLGIAAAAVVLVSLFTLSRLLRK